MKNMPPFTKDGQGDESVERLKLAMASAETGVWDRDFVRGEIHYSASWKALLGYAEHEVGTSLEEAYQRLHPDEREYVAATLRAHFRRLTPSYEVEHRLRCKDGSYRWVCSRGRVVARDEAGRPQRMIGTTVDITALREMAEQVRRSLTLLTELTNAVPGFVFQLSAMPRRPVHLSYASGGVKSIYGLTPALAMVDIRTVLACIHEDDRRLMRRSFWAAMRQMAPWCCEHRVLVPGMTEPAVQWRRVDARPQAAVGGGVFWHGLVTDITPQKNNEHELQRLATQDSLTGLFNRRWFTQALERELARAAAARPAPRLAAVLMGDLDHFKRINDTWGHLAGDEALRHVGALLRKATRGQDLACRLGGEEFAILLRDATVESAMGVAERLRASVASSPLLLDGQPLPLTLSLGVTVVHPQDASVDAVLERCDRAMYRAKALGRDRVGYEPPEVLPGQPG